jgi:hypothetical protein
MCPNRFESVFTAGSVRRRGTDRLGTPAPLSTDCGLYSVTQRGTSCQAWMLASLQLIEWLPSFVWQARMSTNVPSGRS